MRRSERLIRITKWLVDRPNHPVSLSDLSETLDAAKSSLSEDVAIVRSVFEQDGEGTVSTIQGASGGVKYLPRVTIGSWNQFVANMVHRLTDPSRILPGGFLFMSDILADPHVLDFTGRVFAEAFANEHIDVVVTVETKGIPLAVATARYLHTPFVIVRREHRVTDGAAVSVHYVSGSAKRIQTMSVSKRAMPDNARVLIVDDFMRAGATAKTVFGLLAEFSATVVGTAVFMSTLEPTDKMVNDYISLFQVGHLEEGKAVKIVPWEFPH